MRFVFGIEEFEDLDSDSDSEIELGLEIGEEVVAGYNLYTSSRDSLASGTIKSRSKRDWRYCDGL